MLDFSDLITFIIALFSIEKSPHSPSLSENLPPRFKAVKQIKCSVFLKYMYLLQSHISSLDEAEQPVTSVATDSESASQLSTSKL